MKRFNGIKFFRSPLAFASLICVLCLASAATAQQQPVILESADSLVGNAQGEVHIREFLGNVRLRQGDVRVRCDRAVQNVDANSADLYGNVIVEQKGLTMYTPQASYDGRTKIATARRGIRIVDNGRTIQARTGIYNANTRFAWFADSVIARDDTLTLWSDRATYDKTTSISTAAGQVVSKDTVRNTVVSGDSMFHDPRIDYLKVVGTAQAWAWGDTTDGEPDTTYLLADSLESISRPRELVIASGRVELRNGSVAATADSIAQYRDSGVTELFGMPVLWADSSQLFADTITVFAPNDELERIVGVGKSMLVSRADTLRPDRFDQIAGATIIITVENKQLRQLRSIANAQSITWREEQGEADGLAQFASDTIVAEFRDGKPVDVYWLEGVECEYHPEPIVVGREQSYQLRGFEWMDWKPEMRNMSKPWSISVPKRYVQRTTAEEQPEVGTSTKKKKAGSK